MLKELEMHLQVLVEMLLALVLLMPMLQDLGHLQMLMH